MCHRLFNDAVWSCDHTTSTFRRLVCLSKFCTPSRSWAEAIHRKPALEWPVKARCSLGIPSLWRSTLQYTEQQTPRAFAVWTCRITNLLYRLSHRAVLHASRQVSPATYVYMIQLCLSVRCHVSSYCKLNKPPPTPQAVQKKNKA